MVIIQAFEVWRFPNRVLEHILIRKWEDVSDKDMLQVFDCERGKAPLNFSPGLRQKDCGLLIPPIQGFLRPDI
jgi:hypothetical protein